MSALFIDEFEQLLRKNLKFSSLNEMQRAAYDAAQEHPYITLLSNTGSGKTIAFLAPLIERFTEPAFQTQALVITPTRELTLQIEEVVKSLKIPYKITSCYGGHKREIEENELIQPPKMIIGTPGRLCDHIRRGSIDTTHIQHLVIDEFDKSLELGYMDDIQFILDNIYNVQSAFFTSATSVESPVELDILVNAHTLDFRKAETYDWDKIFKHSVLVSSREDKAGALYKLLCEIGEGKSSIVFCNTKDEVYHISQYLKERRVHTGTYHGSMEQYEREASLAKFRMGAVDVLICTDIASRGLDIQNLRYVIHYDLPDHESAFTHRNGRTARMDASGTIIAIVQEKRIPEYLNTEEFVPMDISGYTETPPEKPRWVCFRIPYGKKNKVNKVDIVGFFINKGQLKKEDIGLIEVRDFESFVAVKRGPSGKAYALAQKERIKGKLSKITVA